MTTATPGVTAGYMKKMSFFAGQSEL